MPKHEVLPPSWLAAMQIHVAALINCVQELARKPKNAVYTEDDFRKQNVIENAKKEIYSCGQFRDDVHARMADKKPCGFLQWEGGPFQKFSHGVTLYESEYFGIFLYRVNEDNWRCDVFDNGDFSCVGGSMPDEFDNTEFAVETVQEALAVYDFLPINEISGVLTKWFCEYVEETLPDKGI